MSDVTLTEGGFQALCGEVERLRDALAAEKAARIAAEDDAGKMRLALAEARTKWQTFLPEDVDVGNNGLLTQVPGARGVSAPEGWSGSRLFRDGTPPESAKALRERLGFTPLDEEQQRANLDVNFNTPSHGGEATGARKEIDPPHKEAEVEGEGKS